MERPYIIAEIGVNYYDIAKQRNISLIEASKLMVKEANNAGADAVKFQSYKADKIASKNSPSYWDLSKESTNNQYDLFKKFDKFGEKEYTEIEEYCKKLNIGFMSTPFDLESVDYLDKLVNIHKISSSDITNFPLIKKIAKTNKKILLSTGASNIGEIGDALQVIYKEGNNKDNVVLLHCVLNYPTLDHNANLNMIKDLKQYGCEVGYSDHTLPNNDMLALTLATVLGATYIEKHFTLDKTLPGNDHYHAMDPKDLKQFIKKYQQVNRLLGNKNKVCLLSESISRLNARRSVYVTKDLKKGTILKESDLICKRPAHGICASDFESLIGKKINTDIKEDTAIQINMVI